MITRPDLRFSIFQSLSHLIEVTNSCQSRDLTAFELFGLSEILEDFYSSFPNGANEGIGAIFFDVQEAQVFQKALDSRANTSRLSESAGSVCSYLRTSEWLLKHELFEQCANAMMKIGRGIPGFLE